MTAYDWSRIFAGVVVLSWLVLMILVLWPEVKKRLISKKYGKVQTPNFSKRYIEKPWGGENIWAHTPKYVGKILFIKAGHQLSKQYHKVKDESIFIISGQMQLTLESESTKIIADMLPGDCVHIPPGVIHRMKAITDVEVAEVSTPELDDVVRLEDSYGRV